MVLKKLMASRRRISAIILAAVALLTVIGIYQSWRPLAIGLQQQQQHSKQHQWDSTWPVAVFDVHVEFEPPPYAISLRRPGNLSTVFTAASEGTKKWEADTFCRVFIEDTFTLPLNVCSSGRQVRCYGARYSTAMAQCTFENVLVRPSVAYDTLAWGDRDKRTPGSNATQLVGTSDAHCGNASTRALDLVTQRFDPVRVMAHEALASSLARPEDCESWVEETTYVFTSSCEHVYFRFMAWYGLFKSLLDHGSIGSHKILRLDETHHSYMFADFERRLFPGLYPVQELREKRLCFRKLVTSPWMYSSVPFECKQKRRLRQRCYSCNGKNGSSLSSFALFRKHVLSTCAVDDAAPVSSYHDPKRIVIILRKQYKRHTFDTGKIERILQNEADLVTGMKSHFPGAEVLGIYPEDLDICEQVAVIHSADILVGLHGAGLVHLWWLRDPALLLELVPGYERDNPTFRMLSALTGTMYISLNIEDVTYSKYIMKVNVTKVLQALDGAMSSHHLS